MERIFGLNNIQFSQITLLGYIVILVPVMLVGFIFARRKKFRPHHKWVMTLVTLANWALILLHMSLSYSAFVAPASEGGPLGNPVGDPANLIPTIHLVTGGLAQILATYLVILMWTERTRFAWVLPKALQIRNIKPFMRTTLALWLVTAALGAVIYLTWYPPSAAATGQVTPVPTEEATQERTPPTGATDEASPVATAAVETTEEP
jgi:uncharacterized membrane protein YozB (DUF420 family)